MNIIIEHDVPVTMRDGTELSADVYRPADSALYPVVVERTPYGKQQPLPFLDPVAMVRQGYIYIMQDVRGRNASGGDFVAFAGDESDGYDTVEWAARIPGSNGSVFLCGMSYTGLTQWSAAVASPPSLRAIVPMASPSLMSRTLVFEGGVPERACLAWFLVVGADVLIRRHRNAPQALAEAMGTYAVDVMGMDKGVLDELPVSSAPALTRNSLEGPYLQLLERDPKSASARALDSAHEYERVKVPALVVCGWYDFFIKGSVDQYVGMRARAGSELARGRTRLVLGPWTHFNAFGNIAGERNFGMEGAAASLAPGGIVGLAADFMSTAADPAATSTPVKIFVMGENTWRDEAEWPLARQEIQTWRLTSDGDAGGRGGLLLGPEEPIQRDAFDTYRYDPLDPATMGGGNTLLPTELAGPRDQRVLERRADVLTYTSAPLTEDTEVTGSAIVRLWVSTDVADTDFLARLVDVEPDGTAWNIAEGIIRLSHQRTAEGIEAPGPAEPGQRYLVEIELSPTSNCFRRGHSLRVDVTSSGMPRWARHLNVWATDSATEDDARIASNTVWHSGLHQSTIDLPVIPR